MKRSALSLVLAIIATLILAVTASASDRYQESISGTELPNATNIEGQFVGTADGSFDGGWFIDVKHQDLSHHPAAITGGSFSLDTVIGGWPKTIYGQFTGGSVWQTDPSSRCVNQHYRVAGRLSHVGINGGGGSGSFNATLTHYRHHVWFLGCVVYSATVTGSVSLTF